MTGVSSAPSSFTAGKDCNSAFDFPLKASTTVTFRAGSSAVTGPDVHDGKVLAASVKASLVLR